MGLPGARHRAGGGVCGRRGRRWGSRGPRPPWPVIVHVTGGADSDFSALYILVIAVSAVLMPVVSGLLVTLLGGLLYVADILWGHPVQLSLTVWLQILVFVGVAVATGYLASRVGVVGAEREVLQREVTRLRLEAGDILRNIGSGEVTVGGGGNL